jgi:hypothetical protein
LQRALNDSAKEGLRFSITPHATGRSQKGKRLHLCFPNGSSQQEIEQKYSCPLRGRFAAALANRRDNKSLSCGSGTNRESGELA